MIIERILRSGRAVSVELSEDDAFDMALRLFEGRGTAEDLAYRDAVLEELYGRGWIRSAVR